MKKPTKAKKPAVKKPEAKPVEAKPVEATVVIEDSSKQHLENIGFKFEWLQAIGKAYKFEGFEYVKKFSAFRCIQEDRHVEWIDVNTLALLNGKQALCVILNKHQPLSKARKIIQLPWDKL
tara:strand:- start:6204 stop:6566 length:363 start_codon:yes stop_codon:yes gene_type:complete